MLKYRPALKEALCGFDIVQVSRMRAAEVSRILEQEPIIKNQKKLELCVEYAKILQKHKISLLALFQQSFEHRTHWYPSIATLPRTTVQTDSIAKMLQELGMSYIGSRKICSIAQCLGFIRPCYIEENPSCHTG